MAAGSTPIFGSSKVMTFSLKMSMSPEAIWVTRSLASL